VNSLQLTVSGAPFSKLKVWQKAHALTLSVYKESRNFPKDERYGYTSQIRRAALSTSTNIVEGSKRRTPNDFRHFLNMAEGSNEEVKYLLIVGADLEYLHIATAESLIKCADEIGAMLHKFSRQLLTVNC
jgi:four helix bundle protein